MRVDQGNMYLEGANSKPMIELWMATLQSRAFVEIEDIRDALKEQFDGVEASYPAVVSGFPGANSFFKLTKLYPPGPKVAIPHRRSLEIIARTDFDSQTVRMINFGSTTAPY